MMKKTSSSGDLTATSHLLHRCRRQWPKVIMMTKGCNEASTAVPAAAVKAILVLVILTTTFAITDGIATGQASFFGSSHVSVQLKEARSSSDIYFRLRTRRADSMLFLAAGRTDYCLLVLDAGRLKVHINLGAGETEIASEAPFLLNDMKWHAVNLTRRGSQLTIQVDSHLTKANLPVRFHELNIHFGIWLGGLAGFNEIFLGNLPSFRGCMSHITYNNEDILLRAKTQNGQINGITWNCSDEFDAASSDPFSLIGPTSYVISRVAIARQGTNVKLNIRPAAPHGLIFYVSGMSSRPDYLALELHDGKPKFTAEMGSGPIVVEGSVNTTDFQWHAISLQVSPSSVSLTVDNETWTSETPARGASRHLDVSEMVYLGVEETKRSRLRSQGLIDHSLRGCIRNFYIDNKLYGLPEVDVTNNITTGCFLKSRANKDCGLNCTDEGKLKSREGNVTSTSSLGREVITIPRDVIRIVTMTAIGELEIMRVSPVPVAEGESIIITPRHLAITLDLTKFGVRESGVLFRVSKGPQQGRLEVATRSAGAGSSSRTSESFSLLDVGAGRVRYYHNGAEGSRDQIELVLKLVPVTGFLLPAYLQDEKILTLPIEITAVNDPPEIRLVPGGVLRLAEGTKIRLTPEVITSLDPDTPPEDLHFTLMSLGTGGGGGGEKRGYLELSSDPGKPIQSFTQADLQAGRVWYVDQGLSSSKMAMKVTDESSVSQTAVLRIETFSLRIAPELNTGLEVANVMGTAALISSSNLSFTSNAADQGLVIEYHVVNGPRAGALQLRRTNGQWTNTEHFSQLDLQSGRVRYLLQRPSDIPSSDEFTFHVSLSEVKVPSEFRFRLRIVPLRVESRGTNEITLNDTTEAELTSRTLDYRTFPMATPEQAIKYTIVSPPKFGSLVLSKTSTTSSGDTLSIEAMHFSQYDITMRRVIYKFKWTPYSAMTDEFLFNVTTSQLKTSSGPHRYQINHRRIVGGSGRSQTVSSPAVVKPLLVREGGREVITKKLFGLRIGDPPLSSPGVLPSLSFNVTSTPQHGTLRRDSSSVQLSSSLEMTLPSSSSSSSKVESFSWTDIEKGRIQYEHEGSETPRDKIGLIAWSAEGNLMFVADLDVIVEGVNNHPPRPSPRASLSLNVVLGGMKRLTKDALDFLDEDWDSERSRLKYSTRGSTGRNSRSSLGNIYDRSASLSRPIFQWTQADIDAGKLVFKHEGSDTAGSLPFWVTDGVFTINGTLEISAGVPWIHIVNATRLAGKRGSMARLTDESIRIETNVDVDESRILIRILEGPQHGIIRVNETTVRNFTLGDMARRVVIYENRGTTDAQQDGFRFRAQVLPDMTQSEDALFEVAIYPEAYWTPLNVGANRSVLVNENSSAVISQSSLHILNPHIPPTDIVYTLTRPPRHGYLAIDPVQANDGKGVLDETDVGNGYVKMWDQTVINEGRLRYIQSEPNKTHDSMEFDVTNGVQTLKDLRLDFIVVPTTLLLASMPVIVNEGASIALNITHLHAAQNYFADKLSEVRITSGPEHGTLTMISRPKSPLRSFPYRALQDGKIFYTHDGSETLKDQFTVIAQTDGLSGSSGGDEKVVGSNSRTSLEHILIIQVLPANDQIPKVVNNTGNWVWAGSSVPITPRELAAADDDSDANQLVFYVVGTRGGYPALKSQPNIALHNFTQVMINQSQIIFVHKGEDLRPAWFEFELSDGLNEAAKESFNVTVRKPELMLHDGRLSLPVFPLTQSPLKPENLFVKSSDGREITFQVKQGPVLGQLLMERSPSNYSLISSFTQTDVNNGKIFYQHTKAFRGQKGSDFVRFTASSRFADPLDNVTVEIDVSVSGAALGGLQRYVSITPLVLKEGAQVAITNRYINLTAISDFISMHHRGNIWRSSESPTLKLLLLEEPRHGELVEDGKRLSSGSEVRLKSLTYVHDDSETTEDSIQFTLWLSSASSSTTNSKGKDEGALGIGSASSTWLLNVTLPVHITPVNDQPFQVSTTPRGPILAVVQEHWRKLSRNDLLTSDPDTPPAHIVYEVSKVSHGRFVLTSSPVSSTSTTTGGDSLVQPSPTNFEPEYLKQLPTVGRFTQADVDAGKVVYCHSGPIIPVSINLKVSDGHFPSAPVSLTIPVQAITLQASQSQAAPVRIQQGTNVMALSVMNLPCSTNGHLGRLVYNITRLPLHGRLLLQSRNSSPTSFSHYELARGELSYVQSDIQVSNDSFEVQARFPDVGKYSGVSTNWLVNVVTVPLLRRVKEVRSFVKGYAVGGILAPDEAEFSASSMEATTLNLAVLDASPLAAITGANPVYEILLGPKFGVLYKVPYQRRGNSNSATQQLEQQQFGRVANRFSHEDIRRGSIIYSPLSADLNNNEIIPFRYSSSSSSASALVAPSTSSSSSPSSSSLLSRSIADEFVFRVFAPGVQPALGIAKFNIRDDTGDKNRFYDDKTHNQIISDGSTDPATKRSGGGSTMRDITLLVTPHMTKDSLITIAVVVGGIITLSLFLIVGIRCTCTKSTAPEGARRSMNNGCPTTDPKCISNGIIDAYTPSTLDPCNSDSDTGTTAALRPLMMSTLSPHQSRHCHHTHSLKGNSNRSDSGSWTSCSASASMPTPSIPQCRVTPLCGSSGGGNSSDSGGYSTNNSLMMCPLLPPAPICDTFAPLPEEIDPPEPYGFTYGSVTNTLLPPPLSMRDVMMEETPFDDSNTFPRNHHPPSTLSYHSNAGTLRSSTLDRRSKQEQQHQQQQQQGGGGGAGGVAKNQYWV